MILNEAPFVSDGKATEVCATLLNSMPSRQTSSSKRLPSEWARTLARLTEDGCEFVGPASGDLACGYEGIGRMSEVEDILKAVRRAFGE